MSTLDAQIWMLQAFDVGYWISLEKCRKVLNKALSPKFHKSKRAPANFGLDPLPLIWDTEPIEVNLQGQSFRVDRRAVIYDFGTISISLRFKSSGSLEFFRDLSIALNEEDKFYDSALETLDLLVKQIKPAIEDYRQVPPMEETYFVFQLNPKSKYSLDKLLDKNQLLFAQILRSEDEVLSAGEITESLRQRISYGPNDLVVLDWAAALIMDTDCADTLAVLDFANAKLLEMRYLDNRLENMLEEAYRMIHSRGFHWQRFFRPYGKAVGRLAELMADASAEFEAVNNAIKLTNDQYLARVYRLAAERFHLYAFDEYIARKLKALWDIHQVFIDRASHRRQEVLEWIIILLIAFEIVIFFE